MSHFCTTHLHLTTTQLGCPVCRGAKEEQERIIKLLEDNLYYAAWEGIFKKTGDGLAVDVQDIIALIKGEK